MRTYLSDFCRNNNGKLSGSGLVGVFSGFASIAVILAGTGAYFFHYTDPLQLIEKGLMGLTISGVLLGIRKLSKDNTEFKKE